MTKEINKKLKKYRIKTRNKIIFGSRFNELEPKYVQRLRAGVGRRERGNDRL